MACFSSISLPKTAGITNLFLSKFSVKYFTWNFVEIVYCFEIPILALHAEQQNLWASSIDLANWSAADSRKWASLTHSSGPKPFGVCERRGRSILSPDDPFLSQKVIATELCLRAAQNSRTGAIFHIARSVILTRACIFRSEKRWRSQKRLKWYIEEETAGGCVLVVHSSGAAAAVYWAWLIRPNQVRCLVGLRHAPIYIKKCERRKTRPVLCTTCIGGIGTAARLVLKRCPSLRCVLHSSSSAAVCMPTASREN